MTRGREEAGTTDTFDEKRLRADIVSAWGEYGAHADVFDFMVKEIERLREQRIYLVAALREARPLMSDGEIAFRFDAPGTRGETILLAAFAGVDSDTEGGAA